MCYPEVQSHFNNKDVFLYFYLGAAKIEVRHWLECSAKICIIEKYFFNSRCQFFPAFSGAQKSLKNLEKYKIIYFK